MMMGWIGCAYLAESAVRRANRYSKLFLEMLFLFWALEPKFRSKLCFAQLFFSLV